jgi:hypothetical protein
MQGSFTQAAFFYQNHIAALKLLELLDFGSPVKAITLENYKKGPHIDDIIVETDSLTQYYQVKWSAEDNTPYTINNLISTNDDESKPLIRSLADGFSSLTEKSKVEIILFSTKRASNQKRPSEGITKGLVDLITKVHKPFVDDPKYVKVSEVPDYQEFASVLGKIESASGLHQQIFSDFLKRLRFELDQPDKETQKEKLQFRLDALGIDRGSYETLITAAVEWSISGRSVRAGDVLERLGLTDRFLDRITHDFKVEQEYFVDNPDLFAELDTAIASLEGGFILIEGPPGSGKSTYLTEYKRQRTSVRFAYYCFVPNEIVLGNPRLERDTFLKSLCVGIKNSFPSVKFPEPYSDDYGRMLPTWLHRLSELGEKVIFVIDGLDHVDKKKESLQQPLTNYLEGILPPNVFFLLSSQYPEALAKEIQIQVLRDSRRHIRVNKLSEGQVEQFLRRRGLNPSPKVVSLARAKSEGLPVYLYYIAMLLADVGSNEYLQENLLLNLPALENDEIDTYHEFLFDQLNGDELAVGVLALLAVRREFTSTQTLLDLVQLMGVQADALKIERIFDRYKHLLRRADAKGYTIFHNSFREFVLRKTAFLIDLINDALVAYYKDNPTLDETYRNFYRHLFELGKYDEILADCNNAWLTKSWQGFRPFEEISANLNIAWDASVQLLSFKEFVRVAFLQQRFGRVSFNFEYTDGYKPAEFLLNINRPDEALRRIWDGETIRCSPIDFYEFVAQYVEKTGGLLPKRITDIGFEQFNRPADLKETSRRFQARILYGDWRLLFSEAEKHKWRSSDEHTQHIEVASQEENETTNDSIKNRMVDVLFRRSDIDRLVQIANDSSSHPAVHNHAALCACDILIKANQIDEAVGYFSSIDFTLIDRADFNHLIVRIAESGFLNRFAKHLPTHFVPPPLFDRLIQDRPDYGLKDSLLHLYDDLRVSFLAGAAEHRTYELKADSFNPPERNFFAAIIRLANLWNIVVRQGVNDREVCDSVKIVLAELNMDYDSRTKYFEESDIYHDTFIKREVHKIYFQIFDFVATKLKTSYISEIVRYWLLLDQGTSGYKNQKTTINLAKALNDLHRDEVSDDITSLLRWAESQARHDEETYELIANLLECAEAYGYCGLNADAQRLWNELFTLACGVYSRKDYQFSEVIGALENAHKHYPEKTLNRLITLLTLAHQLWGAADDRAVARAFGGLIDFSCQLSPALAIELLRKEENCIFRGELIEALTRTLSSKREIDLRYIWALTRTMNKWDNFQSYNDDTYPAMLHIFQSCLDRNDGVLAQEIYEYARHQLLVEKEMPERLGQFAEIAFSKGVRFSSVESDRTLYSSAWQAEQERITRVNRGTSPPTKSKPKKPTFDELHTSSEADFERFEVGLAEKALKYARVLRREDLKYAYTTLSETLSRLITLRPPGYVGHANPSKDIRHFLDFSRSVLNTHSDSEFEFIKQLRTAFGLLQRKVCEPIFGEDWMEYVVSHFDSQEWLRKFASRMYLRTQSPESEMIDTNLLPLIEVASISRISQWERFCRQHLDGSELSQPLLKIAERTKLLNRNHALELVTEAWDRNKDFFYTYGSQVTRSFLALLFELDPERGKRTVLEGFNHQYKRFPQDIVYHLDQITGYAHFFGEPDVYEFIYSEYEQYNFALVEGLRKKETNLKWIENYRLDSSFDFTVIRYLIHLFDYPPVETRKLALACLFDLIKGEPTLFNVAFSFWKDMTSNAKEHLMLVVYSLTLEDPKFALTYKERLFDILNTPHFNIRQTTKEVLLFCANACREITDEELQKIALVNLTPQVLVPAIAEGTLKEGKRFIPSSYQSNLLYKLVDHYRGHDLTAKIYTKLVNRGWSSPSWMDQESAVHRSHNFNSNFDNIEINGPYFTSVQEVLNETFLKDIQSQNYDDAVIGALKYEFRLYDPSDLLRDPNQVPANENWSGAELETDQFIQFVDIENEFSAYLREDHEWIKLYEDGHVRTGDEDRTERTTYYTFTSFLARRSVLPELEGLILGDLIPLPYFLRHNFLRHEIPTAFPEGRSYPITDLRPIVGVSTNHFRGQDELSIAVPLADVIDELAFSRDNTYSLSFNKNGKPVVAWTEWQRAYDQDRRRQKPKAAGVGMSMRTDVLRQYLQQLDYVLCFDIRARRTADKYKPESKMNWISFRRVMWRQ